MGASVPLSVPLRVRLAHRGVFASAAAASGHGMYAGPVPAPSQGFLYTAPNQELTQKTA
jgi:hypothetical protein